MNKTKKKSLLDVGTNKYLMFDDALTEEKKGFVLTMNPAERSQKPVLLPDQRWERGSISGDSFTGDSRHSRSEHIEAENLVIDVTWAKLDRPYMYEAPAGLVSDKFDLFCLLISAWQVEITVNGRKAAGQTFPMAFQGQNISESCLSLSETWAVPEE
jgi:hypothetical protein